MPRPAWKESTGRRSELGCLLEERLGDLVAADATATESVLRLAHSGKRGRADVRNVINVLPRVDVWKDEGEGQGNQSVQRR